MAALDLNIAIVAPSFEGDGDSPERALAFLADHGLNSTLFLPPEKHPIFSSPQATRLKALCHAISHGDFCYLWAIRGGGGSSLLIPDLINIPFPARKALIGFSDITALHLFAHQNWGWTCIHGPTLKSIERTDSQSIEILINYLQGIDQSWSAPIKALNSSARNGRSIQGPMVGGNLSLINVSVGTPWQVQTQDHILILEDIGEPPYRLAVKLEHLRQSGILDGLKALVLGDFSANPDEDTDPILTSFALKEFADNLSIPVFMGAPVGHDTMNHPFIQGQQVTLQGGEKALMTVELCYP